jgi:hypothetical protein
MTYHGEPSSQSIQGFDLRGQFADGANMYLYARGRPTAGGDPLGLWFIPELLESTREQLGQLKRDADKIGLIQATRLALMKNIAGIYCANMAVADAIMVDATGVGIGGVAGGGVGFMAYETAMGMKASGAAQTELLEFTARNFRANLSLVTGVGDNWLMKALFQAHHMIPQQAARLLEQLGISDMLHNPLFGQWVETAEHTAMHNAGYNTMWENFLNGLIQRNVTVEEARYQVVTFIKEEVIPRFQKNGLVHVW